MKPVGFLIDSLYRDTCQRISLSRALAPQGPLCRANSRPAKANKMKDCRMAGRRWLQLCHLNNALWPLYHLRRWVHSNAADYLCPGIACRPFFMRTPQHPSSPSLRQQTGGVLQCSSSCSNLSARLLFSSLLRCSLLILYSAGMAIGEQVSRV